MIIGHIHGGISSPSKNPCSTNATSTTSADPTLFEVKLIRSEIASVQSIDGRNPFEVLIFPNPTESEINLKYYLNELIPVDYFITNSLGQIIAQGKFESSNIGVNHQSIEINRSEKSTRLLMTIVFDNKFYVSEKVLKN